MASLALTTVAVSLLITSRVASANTVVHAASLCLYSHPSAETVQAYTLPDGGHFSLSFIHSVSGTPVVDQYQLDNDRITQSAEIFEAHGAGLPSQSDELNASGWRHENGHFILELDRPIDILIVRIQAEYDNTLHINDTAIELASLGHSVLRLASCNQESTHD